MELAYSDHDDEDSLKPSNLMEKTYDGLLEEIVDDVFSDLCFSVHRGIKLGYYPIHEYVVRNRKFEVYDASRDGHDMGSDILGNFKGSQKVVPCPCCKIGICSSRFAPHLYCCMGYGRAKRNASKRFKDMYESDHDDDENGSDSSSRKKKKGKSTRKRVRKGQRGDNSSGALTSNEANFTEMTTDDIRECLSQMCGVISERTGRFCRNTLNCSMHDGEQRREVRDLLLGSTVEPQLPDDVQIDVDTVDEDNVAPLWYSNRRAPKRNGSQTDTDTGPTSSRAGTSYRQEDMPSTSGNYSYF
ncbi:SCA7 domain-containing protein [Nephila pilipes]|uniref:SCA7 domain-containing protein n=1 Tax=Nephila pilipes TaxID=299642 RepID=A0A8X6TVR2_NEPPI|nr:SCA7 domain-containing protein [Nephila pilipes]